MTAAPPSAAASKEAVRTVPTTLPAAARLHGENGVARVDRPAKARRALDRHDVAHLRGIEQPRDARHQVLAEGRRGTEHVSERPRRAPRSAARAPRRAACALAGFSTLSTRLTPASCAACAATAAASAAQHHDGDLGAANGARAAHAVGGAGIESSCRRARRRSGSWCSQQPLLLQRIDQLGGVLHPDALLALRRRLEAHESSAAAAARRRARARCSVSSGFFFAFMMSGSFT